MGKRSTNDSDRGNGECLHLLAGVADVAAVGGFWAGVAIHAGVHGDGFLLAEDVALGDVAVADGAFDLRRKRGKRPGCILWNTRHHETGGLESGSGRGNSNLWIGPRTGIKALWQRAVYPSYEWPAAYHLERDMSTAD